MTQNLSSREMMSSMHTTLLATVVTRKWICVNDNNAFLVTMIAPSSFRNKVVIPYISPRINLHKERLL